MGHEKARRLPTTGPLTHRPLRAGTEPVGRYPACCTANATKIVARRVGPKVPYCIVGRSDSGSLARPDWTARMVRG
jgi:hypothetical protein